jgi:hypothetical protein
MSKHYQIMLGKGSAAEAVNIVTVAPNAAVIGITQ